MYNNNIYLRRKNKVIFPTEGASKTSSTAAVASFLKNIENLGYTFSVEAIQQLSVLSEESLVEFYKEVILVLKKLRGDHVKFEPMYPNFPKQVMEASDAELYINAIMHYLGDWVGLRIIPQYEKEERFPLLDNVNLTVIEVGTVQDFYDTLTKLLSTKTSLSSTDKEDLEWLFVNTDSSTLSFPEEIPHKETLSLFASLVLKYVSNVDQEFTLKKYFKTATDVLRLATSLSGGDESLATNTKYKSFSRKERKLILSLLDKDKIVFDMVRHQGKWIRLGERLHPGEYKKQFPKAFQAFHLLRNANKVSTERSLIEKFLEEGQVRKVADLLTKRPGEFARRLDHLLRTTKQPKSIINRFASVANKVSSPVLLQVLNHFEYRDSDSLRMVFPKGNVAKARVLENELPTIKKETTERVVEVCRGALKERFRGLPDLGNVFVDPTLKDFTVPFSQRSASKALRTVSRGSKFTIPKGNTVRFFIYWKQAKGDRTDIDLSATMHSEDWKYLNHVSYTNLRSGGYNACHSGDITSAPRGACEFIDLDIQSALDHGCRYIVMSVLSFTRQPFNTIPECFAGWMVRQKPNSGEIFEPKTVQDKIDLASDTTICLPLILDLKERKVIWSDLALSKNPSWYNNIEGNLTGITLMGKGLSELHKPDLYTLFTLHAEARGTLVEKPEEAEKVFSLTEGTTPFDIEDIVSEYLS